jgi:hypothetical protein
VTTRADRIQAVRQIAKNTGRPVDEVLGVVAESWGLDAFQYGELLHSLKASTPATPDPAVANAARQAAHNAETEARTADILAFRDFQKLKTTNPFAAADFRERNASAIERGRALDSEPPEPTAA